MIAASVSSIVVASSIHLVSVHHLLIESSRVHLIVSAVMTSRLGVRPSLISVWLLELESRLQKHREDINDVLGTLHALYLSLSLLILPSLLSLLVNVLFGPHRSHLFWIAVLSIERIRRFEESVLRKFPGKFAVV